MKKIYNNVFDLIGNTPILKLLKYHTYQKYNLYAKCEMLNPTLSIKDRIVLSMLRDYEKSGILKPGMKIYEASSGNTGTSLAMIGSVLGYEVIITVPYKTSQEKITTIKAYGATVIVCPNGVSTKSSEHYNNKAKILCDRDEKGLYFNQYESMMNVNTHFESTAAEIWDQMSGQIDILIAAASSGGTITGISKFLKEKNKNIKVILADPVGSVFFNHFNNQKHISSSYQVEGAGKDKVCSIHDFNFIDEVIQFTDEEAFLAAKSLAVKEGLLSGGSSGGVLCVADKIMKKLSKDKFKPINIVVVLPDSGFKYLSKVFI
ncbi:cysteine synthase family protein [Francisella sp. 19X1-34]|uniref:PLP-dependent cysteine synthase family protein n=1 Tax=Francisella sp. 19X1-34 TaxID=3087177 RepID=UPI002E326CBC|nr:cysteine synthase family protein [Francisella sp. 19X1-34]MED7789653.1 cysteine synthase family protein [Francisella sp. 19X1-34]